MAHGIGDGVDHGRRRGDRARLAAALDAERVGGARGHRHADIEGGQIIGARHGVIHVACRDQLAGFVIDGILQKRLADALGNAAMDLALDDHRIDHHPEIIDRREAFDRGHAGIGIDLDLADMHACREGEVRRIVEGALFQAGLEILAGEFVGNIGLQRDLAEGHRLVGASDRELAVGEFDILLRGLHRIGSNLLALLDHLVDGAGDRRHADGAGTRAVGAHAELDLVGIAVDDIDLVDIDTKTLRDQLGEGGLVALAMAVRAGQHLDRAGRIDAHFRRFPQADAGAERADRLRGSDAAGLNIAREADAAQLALLGALALALVEAFVVSHFQRLVERGGVIADIVVHDDRRLVREALDVILLAELRRIHAELARCHFHQPFDNEGRLRAPRPAIGIDGRGVGIDAIHLRIDRRDIVLAREQRRVEIGRHR